MDILDAGAYTHTYSAVAFNGFAPLDASRSERDEPMLLGLLAALCFTIGGLFMKSADGVRHLAPAVGFLLLFGAGAVLQSYAMRGAGMAVTYVLVLGLEAALAVGFGMGLLGESLSPVRIVGIGLTLVGIALLRVP